MIIIIGGEKGGTGKTTLATNLSSLFKQNGKDVLLVDTDKQGSASFWTSTRDTMIQEFQKDEKVLSKILSPKISSLNRVPNVQKFGDSIINEIQELETKYEDIIIDAGGRDSVELRAAITVANLLFIPIQASQFDVWTLGVLDNLITQAKIYNKALKAFIVFNRASSNPSVNEVKEATLAIAEEFQNFKLCKTIIRDRIIYRKAAKNGLSINELLKQDEKANIEMLSFYKEVINGTK